MTNDEKVVFAITDDPKDKTVILGVSDAAWNFMKDGMTHTFDLRSLGVPFKIILFGGRTNAQIRNMLNTDKNTLDVTGIDFGFGGE